MRPNDRKTFLGIKNSFSLDKERNDRRLTTANPATRSLLNLELLVGLQTIIVVILYNMKQTMKYENMFIFLVLCIFEYRKTKSKYFIFRQGALWYKKDFTF